MNALIPLIEATRCVRYRYRYSECRRCLDACAHGAIALSDEGVTIDAGKCRNCALCSTACPTGALGAGNLHRIDLLRRAIGKQAYSFACTPSGLAADATVPCLGALDGAMLAYLAKRGVGAELRGASHCEDCEHGMKGAAAIAEHIVAKAALEKACAGEAWARTVIAETEPAKAAAGHRPGRRQLFRRFLGKGAQEVMKAVEPANDLPIADKAVRPGPWHLPETRELLSLVCKGPAEDPCRLPAMPSLPLGDLLLGRGCTHCEACVRACPTGAMRIRESEADWMMLFLPNRCVGCGVCLEVCQPRALRRAEIVDAAPGRPPVALTVLAKQRCNRCDRFFVSAEPTAACPLCLDDDAAFGRIFSNNG